MNGEREANGGATPPGDPQPAAGAGLQFRDFRIEAKLGEGGMGVVYRAHQISMDRDVALKILPAHLAENAEFVERFQKEARMSAKLHHPNIVGGIAVGEENGLHYFAMEYVDGDNLEQWRKRLTQLSVGDALRVCADVARALDHANTRGVLHRDIKPANIIISRDGTVKLADLGLAKVEGDDGRTQIGEMAGTPAYMAPEQARNAKFADHRCDLYALGTTLYVLLTGQKPFNATTPIEWVEAKERGTFVPPSRQNPKVPEALDRIVAKLLAADPRRRYQTAGELINEIEATRLMHSKLHLDGNGAEAETVITQQLPSRPATRKWWPAASAALLLLGGAAAYWLSRAPLPAPVADTPPIAEVKPPPVEPPRAGNESTDAIVSGSIELFLAGQVDDARAVLRQGLADHPGVPVLTRMLAESTEGTLLLFQYGTPQGISPAVPLWIADGVTLTARDNYRFAIIPARACYVYAFQRDTRPTVTRILPNPIYSRHANPLQAGQLYWLPEKAEKKERAWMYLDTSIGEEQVYVIAATRPARDVEAMARALVNGAAGMLGGISTTPEAWFDGSRGAIEPCFKNGNSFMEVFRFNHK